MAKIKVKLPTDIINAFNKLDKSASLMCTEMTRKGAEVSYDNVVRNMEKVFDDPRAKLEPLKKCLKITRSYVTPSDDGINTKVGFYGYFINRYGKRVPAPLVVYAREYGTYQKNVKHNPDARSLKKDEYMQLYGEAKRPFFRKSFNKKQIMSAMDEVQEKYIPKELKQ